MGAVDFHLQPDAAAGDLDADGVRAERAAAVGADSRRRMYRDDLVLRAARTLEVAQPVGVADLG